MLILTLGFWLHAVVVAAMAICFAVVLVEDDNALLCPIIRWCRVTYRGKYGRELDEQRWWKPLWGCPKCVAGQWGFWGFLLLFPLSHYSLLAHMGFAAITILFAAVWRAIYAWSQSVQ
ncbi:MAG: hypothetical protein ACRYFZ_09535 [Janthinobacterium lividum]